MLQLPYDVIINILCYTSGTHYETYLFGNCVIHTRDVDEYIKYPERRDALQLFCTCTAFNWLKDIHYTSMDKEKCTTVTLFGVPNGPYYRFYKHYEKPNDKYPTDQKAQMVYYCNGKIEGCHAYSLGGGKLTINGVNYTVDTRGLNYF